MKTERFSDFFNDAREWQKRTFRHATPESKIAHLRKEVEELAANPADEEEYADCMLLLVGAWAALGKSSGELIVACRRKLEINKARKWGEPDENGVVEHVRDGGGTP